MGCHTNDGILRLKRLWRRQQGQRMTVQVHIASSRHRYFFPLPKALILSSRAERMEKLYTLRNVRRAAEGPHPSQDAPSGSLDCAPVFTSAIKSFAALRSG